MEDIDKQLHNLSSYDLPVGVHKAVMLRAYYKKLQPIFAVVFALLALSFLSVIWYIYEELIDAQFTDMVKDFFEVFSFNFSFVNIVFTSFFDIVSPALVLSAVLSLAGTIYTGRKMRSHSSYYFVRS